MWRNGIQLLNYIDDWLVCAPSESLAQCGKSYLVPTRSVGFSFWTLPPPQPALLRRESMHGMSGPLRLLLACMQSLHLLPCWFSSGECAKLHLLAPNWSQRPRMAEMNEMLKGQPWRLPVRWVMSSQVRDRIWHLEPQSVRLHVWYLNGSICTHLALTGRW